MLVWAHSIVVVHGISGPKTRVRFPVCSFFYPHFFISSLLYSFKTNPKYTIQMHNDMT